MAAVTTAALATAAVVGYVRWTLPDRAFTRDAAEVVGIASDVAEATGTFSPGDPVSAIDRARVHDGAGGADAFKAQFASTAADCGEAEGQRPGADHLSRPGGLGSSAASVTVIMRGTQVETRTEARQCRAGIAGGAVKLDDGWKVVDVSPINSR